MCKSEIFAETINLVAQETEIPASRILSSDKDTETVDARYLLVQLLVERGMYPSQIAPKIHKTKRANGGNEQEHVRPYGIEQTAYGTARSC